MNSLTACFDRMDAITEANRKVVDKHVELKERLVRRNGQKSVLYTQKKNGKCKTASHSSIQQ